MCNICARFSHNAQYMHKILSQCAIYAQDCTYFPKRNRCATFAQDCTYFLNAQYMRKIVLISSMRNICARLYLFPQCAISACTRFAQDCTSFSNAQYMRAQDLRKIVLISSMRNICTRLYFSPQCAIFAQDCRHYWEKYVTCHISALNLEWYSLHCYFWITMHKH